MSPSLFAWLSYACTALIAQQYILGHESYLYIENIPEEDLQDPECVTVVKAQCGVPQGGPCSGFWFGVGMQPALKATAAQHPQVALVAYHDDIGMQGPPENVTEAFKTLKDQLADVDLRVNDAKTMVYG